MKTQLLIGIDLGSSSLKALALEAASGRTVALSRMPLQHDRLPGGGCEVGAPMIRSALSSVLRDVAHQLGSRVDDVRAIGCTGHGAGLYALDARHELAGGRAVASTDQRAAARAQSLAASRGPELLAEVGCQPWPGQPTVIAAELLGRDAVRSGALQRLMFAKDYVGFLLSGEIATDASDASTAGLLSVATGTWSPLAFAASGIAGLAPQAFGPLVRSGEVIGTVQPAAASAYGLPAGIPVAMGAIDLLAAMTAVRAEERGRAVSVLGTWCVNAVIGPVLSPGPDVASTVNFGPHDRRLYMENSPSSMANIAWLAGVLGLPDARAVVDLAMSVPLGAGGLRFLPFVNGGGGVTAGFVASRATTRAVTWRGPWSMQWRRCMRATPPGWPPGACRFRRPPCWAAAPVIRAWCACWPVCWGTRWSAAPTTRLVHGGRRSTPRCRRASTRPPCAHRATRSSPMPARPGPMRISTPISTS